jgi:hypothetical protein
MDPGEGGSNTHRAKTALYRRLYLAVIAAVLVVLWLLGFLAFHVSSGLCTQNAIWMWREE